MGTIDEMIKLAESEGFIDENADAKVCQDIVLKALAESTFSKNVTVKGGVVMRSISNSARRATQDMDIDFIRYSLSDESILQFIDKLNNLEGIKIEAIKRIEELKQQDYKGKRVHIRITDESGESIESKIDLGVHKNLSINQEEYCFDIAYFDAGANLLINSKEQMITEKLGSLLKFGKNSTRYKDVFDIYYLNKYADVEELLNCFNILIFSNTNMKESNINDIQKRITSTFNDQQYVSRLSQSRKNWLDEPVQDILQGILDFIDALS